VNLLPQFELLHGRALWLLGLALVCPLALSVHAQGTGPAAAIEGKLQDGHGIPIAGASLSLTREQDTREKGSPSQIVVSQTVITDTQGHFRFPTLSAGTYSIRATIAGYDEASFPSLTVGTGEARHTTLTLNMRTLKKASKPDFKSTAMPDFSDEPNFTVAGVTDTTNLGGHGSDVVVRNREGLAKATAALAESSQPPESLAATEKSLRAAIEEDSASYDTNYRLGKLLVEEGKPREAVPYLERASKINSGAFDGEYELALAHCAAGDLQTAATEARALLPQHDTGEVHHLLAEVAEKRGDPLEAVHEYQRAAELDPTERNYFDWGSELLLHRAGEPAVEVFSKGDKLFSGSVRMKSALGVAWYARGSYDRAVETLCQSSDLDPSATAPYIFLGRIQNVEPTANAEIVARLARFVQLQPANRWANYYYAVSLWKRRKSTDDNQNLPKIEALLQTAIHVDPNFAAAHLQLGILYSERKNLPAALAAYQKAAESNPDLPDAHYRLAQLYRQVGEKSKAQRQLQLYRQTAKKAAEEVERERHNVRQFVYTLRDQTPALSPQ
jgi:tetratricopeptide (TPR) repeat protein